MKCRLIHCFLLADESFLGLCWTPTLPLESNGDVFGCWWNIAILKVQGKAEGMLAVPHLESFPAGATCIEERFLGEVGDSPDAVPALYVVFP